MTESENESKPQQNIKPVHWVFGATVAVLFIAVGILSIRVYRFYAAIEAIERAGGAIERNFGPQWLDDLTLHSEKAKLYFSESLIVSLKHPSNTDHDLQKLIPHLQQLNYLSGLALSGTNISDEGLSYLVDFDHLSVIDISGTNISDHGLQHLSRLENLKFLSLNDCRISDEGIRHLENLKGLEALSLDGTDITDEGLKHLRSLKNLKHLSLSNTGVTDEGCAELLKAIPDLEILDD